MSGSIISPDDYYYSKEDNSVNHHPSMILDAHNINNISSIGAFLSQEMEDGDGSRRAEREGRSNDMDEADYSRFTDDFATGNHLQSQKALSIKERIDRVQAKYQPYGAENEGKRNGWKDEQLSRSESYGSLQQSQGAQSAVQVSIPNSNAKGGLVSNQRSNYKKIGNSDSDYQMGQQRAVGENHLRKSKEGNVVQQSSYSSSQGQNGGRNTALQKSVAARDRAENEEFDSYVTGLKKEHTQYQNKLQELQRRIQNLNEFNQQRVNITTLDQARQPQLLNAGDDKTTSLDKRMVSRPDDWKYQGTHLIRELLPESSRERLDSAKQRTLRQIPQYTLQTRKIEEYDLSHRSKGNDEAPDKSYRSVQHQESRFRQLHSQKQAEVERSSSAKRDAYPMDDQLRYEPLRLKQDQAARSPLLNHRKSTGKPSNEDFDRQAYPIQDYQTQKVRESLTGGGGSRRDSEHVAETRSNLYNKPMYRAFLVEREEARKKRERDRQLEDDRVTQTDVNDSISNFTTEQRELRRASPEIKQRNGGPSQSSRLRQKRYDPFAGMKQPKPRSFLLRDGSKNRRSLSARRADHDTKESHRQRPSLLQKNPTESNSFHTNQLDTTHNTIMSVRSRPSNHVPAPLPSFNKPRKSIEGGMKRSCQVSRTRNQMPTTSKVSQRKMDQSSLLDKSETIDAIDEKSKNSKYRLIKLEKQFNVQKNRSKDQIEQMKKKIDHLQMINNNQNTKIKALANEKSEALSNVEMMHHKLKYLNQRLQSQTELFKQGKNDHSQKTQELERRIEELQRGVRLAQQQAKQGKSLKRRQSKSKQKSSTMRSRKSSRMGRATSSEKMWSIQQQDQASGGVTGSYQMVSQLYPAIRDSSRQASQRSLNPRLYSQRRQVESEDVDLRLRKGSSPRPDHQRSSPTPFVPLRNSSNRLFVEKNIKQTSKMQKSQRDSFEQQDMAEPDGHSPICLYPSSSPAGTITSTAPISANPASSRDSQKVLVKERIVTGPVVEHSEVPSRMQELVNAGHVQASEMPEITAHHPPEPTHAPHDSSKSQMTFGDHITEGTKQQKRTAAVRPYEDCMIDQMMLSGKDQELRGSSFGVSLKDLRKDGGNILITSSQKQSHRDDQRIEGQLVSNSGTTNLRESEAINPFQTNQMGYRDSDKLRMEREQIAPDDGAVSSSLRRHGEPPIQDDVPIAAQSYTFTNKYQEHSTHALRIQSGKSSPMKPESKPLDNSKENSLYSGTDTDKLQHLVLELANQVSGIKTMLNMQIEGKKQNDQQISVMQDNYFRSIDELKENLQEFKVKIEHDNNVLKNEVLSAAQINQNAYPSSIQIQSSNTSNVDSRSLRPPLMMMHPSSISDKQTNMVGSQHQSDYNATLPNNYRHVMGMPFPAGSGGSDGRRAINGAGPADDQQQLRSYNGSGGMNGAMTGIMGSRELSQRYGGISERQFSEEERRVAYYSNKPLTDENGEESGAGTQSKQEIDPNQGEQSYQEQQQVSGQMELQDYGEEQQAIVSGDQQILNDEQTSSSREERRQQYLQSNEIIGGGLDFTDQQQMHYNQQHQIGSFNEPSLYSGPNEEPPFEDQFFAFQQMQDRQENGNEDLLGHAVSQEYQQERSFQLHEQRRDEALQKESADADSFRNNYNQRQATFQGNRVMDGHTPMHSLAQ